MDFRSIELAFLAPTAWRPPFVSWVKVPLVALNGQDPLRNLVLASAAFNVLHPVDPVWATALLIRSGVGRQDVGGLGALDATEGAIQSAFIELATGSQLVEFAEYLGLSHFLLLGPARRRRVMPLWS